MLFSYDWLYNKAKDSPLASVLADLSMNPGVEATLVEGSLMQAVQYLQADLNCLSAELVGRLLGYYSTHHQARKLIQGCGSTGLTHCGLAPTVYCHRVSGSPLRATIT